MIWFQEISSYYDKDLDTEQILKKIKPIKNKNKMNHQTENNESKMRDRKMPNSNVNYYVLLSAFYLFIIIKSNLILKHLNRK